MEKQFKSNARIKSKGIVKVQLSYEPIFCRDGETEPTQHGILIYDEGKKIQALVPVEEKILFSLGKDVKGYYYYNIERSGFMKKNKTINLLGKVPAQNW